MKRIKMTLAAVAVIFATASLNAQTLEEVTKKFNEAAELINGKQFPQAIAALDQTIEMGLNEGSDDAVKLVSQSQKYLPMCYLQQGNGLGRAGKMEEALASFEKAAETGELYNDPASAQKASAMISRLYTSMGGQAFNDKDYAKAAEIFAKGYAANPTDTALALNLAMSYCEMGDLEGKGLGIYKDIIALEARNSKYAEAAATAKDRAAYYLMLEGAKYAGEKNNDEVFATVDKILEIDPANAQAQMLRIQTYTNMKNYDKVIEYGDATAQAQSDDTLKSDAYFLLGAAYQNKENKAKAIEAYRKVTAGGNVATAKAQIAALNK